MHTHVIKYTISATTLLIFGRRHEDKQVATAQSTPVVALTVSPLGYFPAQN
jgi:hypothetical protein